MAKFCVLYRVGGKEQCSPWFASRARAHAALALIRAKHGDAVVYAD